MFKELSNDKERIKTTVFSSFAWGAIAHLLAITSNIAFGDNLRGYLPMDYVPNSVGAALGRWNTTIISNLRTFIYGNRVGFNRCYDILLGFFLISIYVYIIVRMLGIVNTYEIVAICGYSLTSSMMLMYSYYSSMITNVFLGLLLSVVGAFILCSRDKCIWKWLLATCFMCLALGVYQCIIMVSVCAVIIHFLFDVMDNEYTIKRFMQLGGYYFSSVICGMLLYVFVNNVSLRIQGISPTTAGHLNTYGLTSISEYYYRMRLAYRYFFNPPSYAAEVIPYYPKSLPVLYKTLLIIACACILIFILNKSVQLIKKIEILVLAILIPMSFNLMYIITNEETVHSLHLWNYVILFAAIVKLSSQIEIIKIGYFFEKPLRYTVILLVFVIAVFQSKHCNLCHVKMSLVHNECVRYYTSLCTRIQSTEGYHPGMKVMYINEFDRNIKDMTTLDPYDNLTGLILVCQTMQDVVGDETYWKDWMALYCGFDPLVIENKELKKRAEQLNIPHYPSDGSILIMDDTLVVNF